MAHTVVLPDGGQIAIASSYGFTCERGLSYRQAMGGIRFGLYRNGERLQEQVSTDYGETIFPWAGPTDGLYVYVLVSDGFISETSKIAVSQLYFTPGFTRGNFVVPPSLLYSWHFQPVGESQPSDIPPQPPTQPPDSGMLQFTIGSVTYVNGGISNTLEAAPFLSEDGRTMVPVRAIVEGLGSTDVGFNTATQEVTFSLNGQPFALTIGQQLVGNNGESMGAPVIVAGRTFVPVRFVSESVGAQVSWDGATQTVSISK